MVVIAMALAVPAVWGIAVADSGVERSRVVLGSVPMTVLKPMGETQAKPAVVVVHGFAASSVIMEPLGRSFARAGYVVVLPDMSGHGANAESLSSDDEQRDPLQEDLLTVVGWLSEQPYADANRIALVGHSMGAGAVTRFAITNPSAVQATVAISLPTAIDEQGRPRDLLLLYGAAEPARFVTAAREQAQLLYPEAQVNETYGDLGSGDAVSLQVIPGVEHISIVWAPLTASLTLAWIGGAVSGPTGPADVDPSWLWLTLLLTAGALAAIPLARILYRNSNAVWPTPRIPVARVLVVSVGGVIVAAVGASLVSEMNSIIPVAIGDYLGVFFAISALVLWAGAWRSPWTSGTRGFGEAVVPALVMTSYVVLLLVVSARFTWASAAFVGPRWWVWIVLSMIFLAYFFAEARLISRPRLRTRIALMVINRGLVVIVLLASVSLLGAPSILTLLLPFMILLFIILGFIALVISTQASDRFGMALVQSVPLAAIVASSFPLT
jgi:dienelactone hydrolase